MEFELDTINNTKVLIVEDNENNIRVLERAIERYNFKIIIAKDGKKGIELALNEMPDLILLDLMLPELNGFEVCKELKNNPKTIDIPIIIISAKSNIEDIVQGLNLGANDYITKPFAAEIVRARIRTALRLKTLNDELKEKNKKLAELNDIKEQFISMAAHDIKNNLTGILGHCYLLNMKGVELPEHIAKSIDIIRKRSEKIAHLVANLLDLTKIETGNLRLNISKFDIELFLRKYFEDIKLLYKNENVNFYLEIIDKIGEVEIDIEKIDEVLTNLINNAIKFNKPDGSVKIRLEKYSENKFKISVIDTGVGIDKKDIDKLFTKFTQLKQQHAFKTSFKGSGLGLNIVKCIIEAHKGQIGVISELNKGSEFYFILPISQ
ncbi:MAG TPA: hybrid sensor histidine kinase/response regulator [bacterium]|nr:hybrid sensor histidine kinase/response regulator [bacterium]HOL47789.1 hybrid sensor histidine kinase/response regulator [bacterium]HPQ18624.1 hybrid sensor histidine kinase/response regulator [bacterium]